MAPHKKKTTTARVKKKKWVAIHAPAEFASAHLGDTYVTEDTNLKVKYITSNLSTLKRSFRMQNMNMQFRVIDVKEGIAQTQAVGYFMINSAIKRLVRRGRDKISDSFLVKTKDKLVVRIKPLIVTQNQGTHSLQTAIRLEARRVIRQDAFTKTMSELFIEIVEGKLQKLVKENTAKFTPLRSVDIRIAKYEENFKGIVTDDEVKTEEVKRRVRSQGNKDIEPHEVKKEVVAEDNETVDEASEDSVQDDGVDESAEDDTTEDDGVEETSEDDTAEDDSEDEASEEDVHTDEDDTTEDDSEDEASEEDVLTDEDDTTEDDSDDKSAEDEESVENDSNEAEDKSEEDSEGNEPEKKKD